MFTTKLTHHKLTLSPFSAEQMAEIGGVMVTTITDRIRSAVNVKDQPARPLSPKYAARKINKGTAVGRFPVRNWTFRDVTLKSIKVKSASEDRVTVGFVSQQAVNIVTGIARYDQMWGTSPKDSGALYAAIKYYLHQARSIRWVKTSERVA